MEIENHIGKDLIFVETFDDYLTMTDESVHKRIHALQKHQPIIRQRRLQTFQKTYNLKRQLREVTSDLHKQTIECVKNIPAYWGRILKIADLDYNNLADANALKYLIDVQVEDLPLTQCMLGDNVTPAIYVSHRVRFIFQPNHLMFNTEGIKTVSYKVCGWNNPYMEMLEPEIETDMQIKWKPGKDPRVLREMKKRKAVHSLASNQKIIIPSFFHLFDDLKHEAEDSEYSQAIEEQKEEDRKMQFKILLGFILEFVDNSIGYFDETIPNRTMPLIDFDDEDDEELEDDEEFMGGMEEEEEYDEELVNPPTCNNQ